MAIFCMVCGVSSSGKTTFARQWRDQHNAVLYDSDQVRDYLYGDPQDKTHNKEVFEWMGQSTIAALNHGHNVCYCATNLSSKRRIALLKRLKEKCGDSIVFECVIVVAPPEICKQYNALRERKVPDYVIDRQVKQFQCPYIEEGWNSIEICRILPYDLNKYEQHLRLDLANFGDQKNPHHQLSLWNHSTETARFVCEKDTSLAFAALFHDIGKCYTQFIDDEGVAHYYNHPNVGSWCALAAGYRPETAMLICYHMVMFDEKAIPTWKKRFSEETWHKLELLHEADLAAH